MSLACRATAAARRSPASRVKAPIWGVRTTCFILTRG
jgi:hypothetical protein